MKGLVLGLLLATTITASVFSTTIARVDWEKESRAAVERVNKQKQAADRADDDAPELQQRLGQGVGPTPHGMRDDGADKSSKDWYAEEKEQKSNETELAQATAPVRDYHTLAIEEEKKEPPRPLEHI